MEDLRKRKKDDDKDQQHQSASDSFFKGIFTIAAGIIAANLGYKAYVGIKEQKLKQVDVNLRVYVNMNQTQTEIDEINDIDDNILNLKIEKIELYSTPLQSQPPILQQIGAAVTFNQNQHNYILIKAEYKGKDIPNFLTIDFYQGDERSPDGFTVIVFGYSEDQVVRSNYRSEYQIQNRKKVKSGFVSSDIVELNFTSKLLDIKTLLEIVINTNNVQYDQHSNNCQQAAQKLMKGFQVYE